MQRQGATAFAGFLIVAWAILSFVLLAKGGLYIAKHEGDTMHLIDIVLRLADGERPHLDFMTPIGLLATAPIAALVAQGWGVGMAMLGAQVMVAAVLILPIWWVGASRLQTGWAMVFGAICLGLSLALVHGEPQPSLSISMHYNRWAWALAFLAISTAILPPVNRHSSIADGLLMGLCVAVLALIKVTYVAAFLPPILLALLLRREWTAIAVAIVAGLGVVALVTAVAGPDYWAAYLGDLFTVTGSETRPHPGHELHGVIAAPAYLGGSFAALVSVVLLRQAGRANEGLVLLLLVPGFFYVTYQNFGNDPQWLYLLGVLLFALRPEPGIRNGFGWDMRQALALAGCAVFMLGLPSALNLGFSPFRHLAANAQLYQPMFPRSDRQDDIFVLTGRNAQPTGTVKRPVVGLELPEDEQEVPPAILLGETLPECELSGGTITVYDGMARDIEAAGFGGAALFGTDLLTSYWLFGDFRRLPGGAPWRYDGLPGIEHATHLVVPLCPLDRRARSSILSELESTGYSLVERHRTEGYVLLEIQAP